jgi:hypothetical protein
MSRECRTHGAHVGFLRGNQKERDHYENLDAGGRMILLQFYTGIVRNTCVQRLDTKHAHNVFRPMSRGSDWLQSGRPRGRGSSPSRVKNFYFYISSRLAQESTLPPIQCVKGSSFPESKAAGE